MADAVSLSDVSAQFTWLDYVVFSLMLAASASIGVFFGCFGKKQNSSEFLRAGKSMGTFPVSMSLIASFMSAITLLGTPSEVYQFGAIYWLIIFAYALVMPTAAFLYIPVFQKLDVTSSYEYLELRFHRSVRMLGSGIFVLQMLMYMAIVVYAPALALSQVTGMNIYVLIFLICAVCIFYTTIGGMKAILYTDTMQVVIMYGAMIFVIFKAMTDVGGWDFVWEKATEGGRLELINFDPNPLTRHTVFTILGGGYFTWLTIYGVNQAQVQRYMSVRKPYMARRALWINLVMLAILMLTCSYAGLVIYAKYHDCDPIKQGLITKGDQLFPLLVMETLGSWPGMPGFFVAGICSGALSTVAAGMNSLAAITLEDFIKGTFWPNISEENATRASRGLSLFYGLLTFALVFVAEQLGNILSAALSIFGMIGGPLLGVFTLGMFVPWANTKGAMVGTVSSLLFTFWIGIGAQIAKAYGQIVDPKLPTSIEGCLLNVTQSADYVTQIPITVQEYEEPLAIFRLSYLWYSAVGCFTVLIIGTLVSLCTGKQDVRKLNPESISPGVLAVAKWIPGLKELGKDYEAENSKEIQSTNLGSLNTGYVPDVEDGKLGKYTTSEVAHL
ncbi:unnamed protein product [Meganyctiphanes norvegica]|uniref:Sodium-coupled monocarboxylate transporter 1 n=1 Tax=Meganyctiphanes norvegica TaxID=48144 RepID=A0AAV2QLW6_MEGNR